MPLLFHFETKHILKFILLSWDFVRKRTVLMLTLERFFKNNTSNNKYSPTLPSPEIRNETSADSVCLCLCTVCIWILPEHYLKSYFTIITLIITIHQIMAWCLALYLLGRWVHKYQDSSLLFYFFMLLPLICICVCKFEWVCRLFSALLSLAILRKIAFPVPSHTPNIHTKATAASNNGINGIHRLICIVFAQQHSR